MDIKSKLQKAKEPQTLKHHNRPSNVDEENICPIEFEALPEDPYKDDSYLIGRQQSFFDRDDLVEQRMVEQEIAQLIDGDRYQLPQELPSLTFKRSKTLRSENNDQEMLLPIAT